MSLTKNSTIQLLDGSFIPIFGLGVYSALENDCESACLEAIKLGYRMIDTAKKYENEENVGEAIKKSGVKRDEIYVVTKLWDADHGFELTKAALKLSLEKLKLDYVDLYLMHSPNNGRHLETWDAMLELKKEGKAKSIGVSNWDVHHFEGIKLNKRETPCVNQIELHPFLQQRDVVEYCRKNSIALMAYAPLTRGDKLKDPKVVEIAQKYAKSEAQVLIRWSLQKGFVCIPKSAKAERIKENGDVFDFTLSDEDMKALESCDCKYRRCWNPLETAWDKGNVD